MDFDANVIAPALGVLGLLIVIFIYQWIKKQPGGSGDVQKINAWNMRSKNGEENNMWVCVITKRNQKVWSSVSEGGYFNTLEWKKPMILNQFLDELEMISYEN